MQSSACMETDMEIDASEEAGCEESIEQAHCTGRNADATPMPTQRKLGRTLDDEHRVVAGAGVLEDLRPDGLRLLAPQRQLDRAAAVVPHNHRALLALAAVAPLDEPEVLAAVEHGDDVDKRFRWQDLQLRELHGLEVDLRDVRLRVVHLNQLHWQQRLYGAQGVFVDGSVQCACSGGCVDVAIVAGWNSVANAPPGTP